MNTYVVRRRSNWRNAQELEAAASRSSKVGKDDMSDSILYRT